MASQYFKHQFPSGLTLLGEQMSGVQSAAMTLLLPAGAANDPDDARGSATVLSDLVLRGAGARDSRGLIDYLDGLGLQRSSGVGVQHTHFSCAAVGPRVIQSLGTYSDIVRRPKLPEDGFEAARDLALQSFGGLEDEPRNKLIIRLRETHFPSPLGRNPMGEPKDLEHLTLQRCRDEHHSRFCGDGAILSIAGNIDFDVVLREVDKHFGDFDGSSPKFALSPAVPGQCIFEVQPSEQTHIGIAYDSIPVTDPDYYNMRVAIEVLGGGMSGRLFTELREKRGLVYNVWAGYGGLKGVGAILGYAGTSNDRAQASLDCLVEQIHRLTRGVAPEEVARARIGLKASTIIEGESTSGRAAGLAHDYFMLGAIRTLEQIKAAIERVTVDSVNDFLARRPPGPFTIVIVGPKPLKTP